MQQSSSERQEVRGFVAFTRLGMVERRYAGKIANVPSAFATSFPATRTSDSSTATRRPLFKTVDSHSMRPLRTGER